MSPCLYLAALLAAVGAEPGIHDEAAFKATYERLQAASPSDVTFSVKASKRAYHVGELIQLDVTLSCTVKDRYHVQGRAWDHLRTQRTDHDEDFCVWPQAGVARVASDAPKSIAPRTQFPTLTENWDHVILNQWLSFSQPGTYRVYALTNGVRRSDNSQQPPGGLRVTSNMLELEIVPATAQWQRDELARAVKVLDGDLRGEEDLIWAPTPTLGRGLPKGAEAYQRALLRIRYLKTEDAARELARRLAALDIADANARHSGKDEWEAFSPWVLAWGFARFARTEISLALDDSPYRTAAATEFERGILQPSVPVDHWLMSSLTIMKRNIIRSPDSRPYPKDPVEQERYYKAAVELEKLHAQIEKEFAERLWAAIDTKERVAKGETMLTLVRWWYLTGQLDGSARARQRLEHVRETLAAVLDRLAPYTQEVVLRVFWKQLGGPEFVPAIGRIIQQPREPVLNYPYSISHEIDWALRRLFQLSPEQGREWILAEICQRQPQVSYGTLALLPDRPIPALDTLLADRLKQACDNFDSEKPPVSEDIAAFLIHRFASAAILPRVRDLTPLSCEAPRYLLAYYLRVDPKYAVKQVNAEIENRSADEQCSKMVLGSLAELCVTPELERIAFERLDDRDAATSSDAAAALGIFGSAKAQAALWRRMQRLHNDWKPPRPKPGPESDQALLELALLEAIVFSRGWVTDEKKLAELRGLCVTAIGEEVIRAPIESWSRPLELWFTPGLDSEIADARPRWNRMIEESHSGDTWQAAQYVAHSLSDFESLLARFPRGTTFRLPANFAKTGAIETQVRQRLSEFLSRHAMSLTEDKRLPNARVFFRDFAQPAWDPRSNH